MPTALRKRITRLERLRQAKPAPVPAVGPRARLTLKQVAILDYLETFIAANACAPRLEDIGRRFKWTSLATVHDHLLDLERAGVIRRRAGESRAIELTGSCPYCGTKKKVRKRRTKGEANLARAVA